MTTRLCALDELEVDSSRRIDIDGFRLAVIRIGDDVYVIGDECTHADVSLAEGDLDCDERTIECWRHGSAFSVVTGEPESLPAIRPTPTYTVTVADGEVFVDLGTSSGAEDS